MARSSLDNLNGPSNKLNNTDVNQWGTFYTPAGVARKLFPTRGEDYAAYGNLVMSEDRWVMRCDVSGIMHVRSPVTGRDHTLGYRGETGHFSNPDVW